MLLVGVGIPAVLAWGAVAVILWEHPGPQPLLDFAVMLPWCIALNLVATEIRVLRAGLRRR